VQQSLYQDMRNGDLLSAISIPFPK